MDRDGRYSSYPPRPLASPPSTATSPFATPPITATFSPLPHDHLQYGYLDPGYATYSANSSPQLSQDGAYTPPYAPTAWKEAVHAPIAAAAPPLAKPSDRKQRLSKRTGARIDWKSLTGTYRTRNQVRTLLSRLAAKASAERWKPPPCSSPSLPSSASKRSSSSP